MQLVQDVLDGAGAELVLFCIAFLMHLGVFSKYGILSRRRTKASPADKVASVLTPKNANSLALSLISLANESPDAQIDLKLKGNESLGNVMEQLAAAGPEVESKIVQTAVQNKRWDVLKGFFASYSTNNSNLSQGNLLRRLVRKGLAEEALECIKTLGSPRPFLYNVLLEGLAEKKDLGAAVQMFDTAKNAKAVDVSTYNAFIRALVMSGKVDEAKQVLNDMRNEGFSPSHASFNIILEALSKENDMDCWAVLNDMKCCGLKPVNYTCSVLLKGLHKGSRDRHVQKVIEAIESRETRDLDETLLGSLAEACLRTGNMSAMLCLFKKLRHDIAKVHVRCAHTVGSIIRAYGAAEDLDTVWKTWREMQRNNVQPSRITLGCMVEALASNNDAKAAYDIIHEALADPQTAGLVNAVMYSSVLKSFSHQKLFDKVWIVYEEMIQKKLQFSLATYNALLDVCARSGDINRAEPLLRDMVEQGLQPNIITYGTVIKAYCSANRLNQAFAVLSEMKRTADLAPDEVTYNTLLDGCARYGLFDRGLEVLADMRQAGVPPSNYTLAVIAKLANRSKKPEKAFQLVDELSKEFGLHPNMHVYNNLIHAATCHGDMRKAQETFACMLAEKIRPDGRTYALLLRFCAGQKAASTAAVLLRTAAGLAPKADQALHPWKTQDKGSLLPCLSSALQQLSTPSWAAAPRRGSSALQEDVVKEVFDLLVRSPQQVSHEQVAILLAEVQSAMPGLKLDKRLSAMLS